MSDSGNGCLNAARRSAAECRKRIGKRVVVMAVTQVMVYGSVGEVNLGHRRGGSCSHWRNYTGGEKKKNGGQTLPGKMAKYHLK